MKLVVVCSYIAHVLVCLNEALEGSYVDGLERSAEYRLNDKEGVKEQRAEFDQYKTQEDYILHKLFKKSGTLWCFLET